MEIPAERFRCWDTKKNQYVVEPGDYELLIGAASDDIRLRVPVKIVPGQLAMTLNPLVAIGNSF